MTSLKRLDIFDQSKIIPHIYDQSKINWSNFDWSNHGMLHQILPFRLWITLYLYNIYLYTSSSYLCCRGPRSDEKTITSNLAKMIVVVSRVIWGKIEQHHACCEVTGGGQQAEHFLFFYFLEKIDTKKILEYLRYK